MNHSENTALMMADLILALGEMTNPPKTAKNPFYKSKYAPLDQTLNQIRPLLAKHGLAVLQSTQSTAGGLPAIVTRIIHGSGQWIESEPLGLKPQKDDPQGYGGALTYARRYSLEAMLGICGGLDDDGNYSSKPHAPATTHEATPRSTTSAKCAVPATDGEVACPKCDSAMKLRNGRDGQFWGCANYPDCRGTRPGPDEKQPAEELADDDIPF